MVAQTSSGTASTPGMKAGEPMPGTEIGKAADPPCFRTDAGSEKASQGVPTARAGEGDHGETSITPGATAKGASGGRTFVVLARSGASSQSSTSQLQKEGADTASNAGSSGSRKRRART
jgi:hypothetical protein